MLGIVKSVYALVALLIATGSLSVGPPQFAEVNVLYVPGGFVVGAGFYSAGPLRG